MPAYITSIGRAVPKNRISQQDIADFMIKKLSLSGKEKNELRVLYRASGIRFRHSVIRDYAAPDIGEFYSPEADAPFPLVEERMKLYEKEAINLTERSVRDCLKTTPPGDITHLITVSCTGMYAPGIDIELIERLGMKTSIERTAINFMGCYAVFNALKTASYIIRSLPASKVLVVATELCSIHLQKQTDADSILSNSLFGDGSAAALLEGHPVAGINLETTRFYNDLSLQGKEEMAWHIGNFGFRMKLSGLVPEVIKSSIGRLTRTLLKEMDLELPEIAFFAIHPGGKKILEVIEEELGIGKEKNRPAYTVLKQYGNMSSPTILFVIHELLTGIQPSDDGKQALSFAFGPGLTLESMLLTIKTN